MNWPTIAFDGGETLLDEPATHITLAVGAWRIVHKDGSTEEIVSDGETRVPITDVVSAFQVPS